MATRSSTALPHPDQIAEAIERAIVTGEFRPREHLTELHLAQRLGTNRSRVRAALLATAALPDVSTVLRLSSH